MFEKVDNPIKVEFWTKNIKEAVLTIALEEFSDFISQFIDQWECRASACEPRNDIVLKR